ncbi:MAG: BON domain-containing protein [Rhodoglobus sp.]
MSVSTKTATRSTDHDILDLVRREFDWSPQLDASHVAIAVDGAVITLSGEVPALTQVRVATEAALRVKGVSSVANDVTVRLPWKDVHPDRELATAVFDAIFWNTTIPRDRVKIDVSDRIVTLSGELDWNYQRQAAESVAHTIVGVHEVRNEMTLPALLTIKATR